MTNRVSDRSASPWKYVMIAAAVGYLGFVLIVPLGVLVARVVEAGPSLILGELATRESLRALGLSVVLALAAVVINGVLGIAGALVLTRQRFIGRSLLDAAIDVTLAVSPVMIGLGLLLVFGREGFLDPLLRRAHIKVAFAFPGLLICTLFVTLPLTLREISYVLEALGTDEEEVAATLGASRWQTFRRVTLPNIGRALRLGVTLTAARSLGEFGAVLVVGGAIAGRTQTATTFIYTAIDERRQAAALGMAMVLALASMLVLLVLQRLEHKTVAT